MQNDDINTFAIVYHVLRTQCGMTEDHARKATSFVHEVGGAVIGQHLDRGSAEAAVLTLQRHGLRAIFKAA